MVLQCQPHAAHIIPRIAPIAFSGDVTEQQFFLQSQFDGGCSTADLSGNEILTAAGRLVVVHYPVADKQTKCTAINANHLSREGLRTTIGIDGCVGRLLILGSLLGLTENLA